MGLEAFTGCSRIQTTITSLRENSLPHPVTMAITMVIDFLTSFLNCQILVDSLVLISSALVRLPECGSLTVNRITAKECDGYGQAREISKKDGRIGSNSALLRSLPIFITNICVFTVYSAAETVQSSAVYNNVCYNKYRNLTLCTNTSFTKHHDALQVSMPPLYLVRSCRRRQILDCVYFYDRRTPQYGITTYLWYSWYRLC